MCGEFQMSWVWIGSEGRQQDGDSNQSGCWELELNREFSPATVEYYDFAGHA